MHNYIGYHNFEIPNALSLTFMHDCLDIHDHVSTFEVSKFEFFFAESNQHYHLTSLSSSFQFTFWREQTECIWKQHSSVYIWCTWDRILVTVNSEVLLLALLFYGVWTCIRYQWFIGWKSNPYTTQPKNRLNLDQ